MGQKLASDREDCWTMFKASGDRPTFIFVDGEPRSKARPRFTGAREPYRDDKQRRHALLLKQTMSTMVPERIHGNVSIACIFYRSSKMRVDLDNLMKEVFDAANGVIWRDDMQVTACTGILRMDANHPRTAIAVGPHSIGASLDRSDQNIAAICRQCGGGFVWRKYPSSKQIGLFCSTECKNRFGRADLRFLVSCPVCDEPFRRRTGTQSICSNRCRMVVMVARNKSGAYPRNPQGD